MTRMTGPDCAVMCNLINTHTHRHTQTHKKKCPTSGERLIRGYTKFDFAVDEGKVRLNPSRDKIKVSTAKARWKNPV